MPTPLPIAHRRPAALGFTLVEVLVAAGLLVIILGLLFIPISSSLGYFRTATARADAQTVARSALDTMARELAEAMYVQLDMYDNSMVAFVPPLRVNPDDPNSDVVTPPRPDWGRAVRFWRALNEPTRNYNGGQGLEGRRSPNMFFLARTVVPDPLTTDDPWNRWNDAWARAQDESNEPGGTKNWASIYRVVHTDVDYRTSTGLVGARNRTLQPGYPYLAAVYKYGGSQLPPAGVREYRQAVVGLSPNAPEYDIPSLTFTPVAVAGERLQPANGTAEAHNTVYRARYPLWRLGAPITAWSALVQTLGTKLRTAADNIDMEVWGRDPFIVISRFTTGPEPVQVPALPYQPVAIGALDPRTRTIKVVDENGIIYDTGTPVYARRDPLPDPTLGLPPAPWFGFTVDWVDGSLRFDFPYNPGNGSKPVQVSGASGALITLSGQQVREFALHRYWGITYVPGGPLGFFVVPDSVSVRLDAGNKPGRALKRVYCVPHDGAEEFQLGVDPTPASNAQPKYGWIRLPERLPGGLKAEDATLWITYHWRNNGVVPPVLGGDPVTMDQERPDIITAYYRTAAVLDVGLTVTRADPTAPAKKRISQSVNLTRRVKLHNLLREVRYAED